MSLKFPLKWAETFGFDCERVTVEQAIAFVQGVQAHQFGSIIEMGDMNDELERNPENDPVLISEVELNNDIGEVVTWLKDLSDDGQQTISTAKVREKIEDETGMQLKLTEEQ